MITLSDVQKELDHEMLIAQDLTAIGTGRYAVQKSLTYNPWRITWTCYIGEELTVDRINGTDNLAGDALERYNSL